MNLRQIATATIALSSLMFTQTAPLFAQKKRSRLAFMWISRICTIRSRPIRR